MESGPPISKVVLEGAPTPAGAGLAVRWALALATGGEQVELTLPRAEEAAAALAWPAVARMPLDGAAAPAAAEAGAFALPAGARWRVLPAEGGERALRWESLPVAPAASEPGRLTLTPGLAAPRCLLLEGLAGGGELPGARDWPAVHPALLGDALAALAAAGLRELVCLEPALLADPARATPLIDALAASGLSWWLETSPLGLTPDRLAELATAGGLVGVTLAMPTPTPSGWRRWLPGAEPDALAAALSDWPTELPLGLAIEVGAPEETSEQLRLGLQRLRPLAGRVAGLVARPLLPRPGSPARRDPAAWGARWLEGQGPDGWLAGWSTLAWRQARASELTLAAEALGFAVEAPALTREQRRHRDGIVARLTDPFHDAPESLRADRELAGVLHGERAFAGPGVLEIDMTNDCNNTCVGCWCHSPMMGDQMLSGAIKKKFLETEVILELIDDAAALGTRRLQIAGSGEPFMHPDIMPILEHAKSLGLHITIVTNVNYITRDRADRLIAAGVDQLTASVWAGTPEMYVATHPNQTHKSFERIRDVLGYLWQRKRELGRTLPMVKMYHVISSINCRELIPMIDLAVETGAERVELQITDVVPGKSDVLALSDEDRAAVVAQLRELATRAVDPTRTASREEALAAAFDGQAEVAQFGKFEKPLYEGWRWGDPRLETIYCPQGKEGSLPDRGFTDETETRYRYDWHVWDCHRCPEYDACPIDKDTLSITKEFTELIGFGSFFRRVASQRQQGAEVRYEEQIVDKIPCTIGWTYSRVRVSGEVIPCCKGHLHPLGSLHEQSFPQIWFGPTLDELRRMGKHQAKAHPYFERIGCYRSCDNVGNNLETQQRLEALGEAGRQALIARSGMPPFVAAPGPHLLSGRAEPPRDQPAEEPAEEPAVAEPSR